MLSDSTNPPSSANSEWPSDNLEGTSSQGDDGVSNPVEQMSNCGCHKLFAEGRRTVTVAV